MASNQDAEERLRAALADHYRIQAEIGSGGTATAYLAEDLKHHRRVPVKVLRPELADALGAERFLREIDVAANLTHPHILPVFDSGEADGFLYYVMPYVPGGSLKERLAKERQLPVGVALSIAREMADALAHAHEQGVIHRDVKPGNILLAGDHALLADFGVARAVAEVDETRLTQTGISVGTPAYMSPEQAAAEGKLDARSDVYALGCVLYEMLAGQPPFTGPTGESVVRQHLTAEPAAVTQLRPSVSSEITRTITRALAKNPADRFGSASAFGNQLVDGETPGGGTPGHRQWTKAVVGGGAVALALAAGALLVSQWPFGDPNPPEDHLAVFPLENRTSDPELDDLGSYAASWITAGLTRTDGVRVLDAQLVDQVLSSQGAGANLKRLALELGVGTFLTGEITSIGDTMALGVRISRTTSGEQIQWVEVRGPAGQVRTVVDDLQKRENRSQGITKGTLAFQAAVPAPPELDGFFYLRRDFLWI